MFATKRSHLNNALFDSWSGVHAMCGISLNILGISRNRAAFYAIAWEVVENSRVGFFIWEMLGDANYKGDDATNVASDVLIVCLFHGLSKRLGLKKSVILMNICFLYFQIYETYLWNRRLKNYSALQNMVEFFSHGCV
ncbi:MAG: hypothetical protein CMO44_12860 [Verrucomicrobiales bacterium]|nr:hypothetical protein [Verrucomicrobiales bacterium]|tara:strand:+ start:880 stop:1293 length:414 start_codon:yes stop_codon:yes gene_type:complete